MKNKRDSKTEMKVQSSEKMDSSEDFDSDAFEVGAEYNPFVND